MANTQVRADSARVTNIVDSIHRACRTHGIPVTRFGRLAVRDPRFVLDLHMGRTPRPATEARVLQFIESLEA
jgi:hypothetical protein